VDWQSVASRAAGWDGFSTMQHRPASDTPDISDHARGDRAIRVN